MIRRSWSAPEGAWQLKLTQFDAYWTWELIYHYPDGFRGEWDSESCTVDAGVTRSRQKAINQAARARVRYTKRNIPRKNEEIEL